MDAEEQIQALQHPKHPKHRGDLKSNGGVHNHTQNTNTQNTLWPIFKQQWTPKNKYEHYSTQNTLNTEATF